MTSHPLIVWMTVLVAIILAVSAINSGPPGGQGVPGGQCPMLITFMAPDGCSSCFCSGDARMTACTREACPEPQGNYTINECVENALYVGVDGCNTCQCGAYRRFTSCTRNICREGTAPPSSDAE